MRSATRATCSRCGLSLWIRVSSRHRASHRSRICCAFRSGFPRSFSTKLCMCSTTAPEQTATRLIRSVRIVREPARRILERFSLMTSANAAALDFDSATARASTPCGNNSFTSIDMRGPCSCRVRGGFLQEAQCVGNPLAGAVAFVFQRWQIKLLSDRCPLPTEPLYLTTPSEVCTNLLPIFDRIWPPALNLDLLHQSLCLRLAEGNGTERRLAANRPLDGFSHLQMVDRLVRNADGVAKNVWAVTGNCLLGWH